MAYTGNILVTVEALTQKSGEFAAKATEVKTLHDDMLNRINALMGSWESEGAQAYSSKFNSLSTAMDTIYRMIQEHVADLNTMAENYESSEQAAISEIESLPTVTL